MNFNTMIKNLAKLENKHNQPLDLHYFGLYENNQIKIHQFKEKDTPSDIRSLSKTVLTLFLGYIMNQDLSLTLETYIYPLLKENFKINNTQNIPYLKKLKIKHLLTHTIGFEDVLMMRDDIKNIPENSYVDLILNHPILHKPGTYYLYSNAGFYLLSVFLELYLKQDLNTILKNTFFKDLDIQDFTWEKYGAYLAGATRLWLKPEDTIKFGILMLQKGQYNHKQIIDPSFIEDIKQLTTLTPKQDSPHRIFRRYAYGKGIWLAKDKDIFFGHGTAGQTLIVVPLQNKVLLTLSNIKNNEVPILEGALDSFI